VVLVLVALTGIGTVAAIDAATRVALVGFSLLSVALAIEDLVRRRASRRWR
jgi:hypothetical protein